ncbi:Neurotrypsin, partial [Geodia barretti]
MVTIPAHIHSVNHVTSVIWYRNGTQLDPESDSRYTATVSDNTLATLEIDSLRDEDVGVYVVVVTNSDDSIANASVEVKYPVLPSARVSPSRRTVEVGDSVDVVCATDGTGPLDTQWTAENGDVVADGNRLTIATATLVHSGVYTCTVSSPFSAAQATFDLTVLSECIEGNVTGSTNGRLQLVEMCNSDGVWSPLCDNEWTQEDATVVCRELGYQEPKSVRYETINKTMVNATHISCRGNETALRDCVSTEPPVNAVCQLALVDCSPDVT